MYGVRFHGRAGQGTTTAAQLLSAAVLIEGKHAQAFASFGSERTGTSVMSFCRVDNQPIWSPEPVAKPDALIIQDPTLLDQVSVFDGVTPSCRVLINSARPVSALRIGQVTANFPCATLTIPATEFALTHLGMPVPNVAMLGGLAAFTGLVTLDALVAATVDLFMTRHDVVEGNACASWDAYRYVIDKLPSLDLTSPGAAGN